MKSMIWRGVRNWPASPWEPSTESRYSKGVAETLRVVVAELVNDLQEGAQRLRVPVGEIGIVEYVPEERRDTGVLRHPGDGLGVQVQGFVPAHAWMHQLGPAVSGEVSGEELTLPAPLLALGVDVVHELVDESNGDLFHLALGVGDLAHEYVPGCVYAAFGVGVQHRFSYAANWFSET